MWKLPAHDPFTYRNGYVIAREIVYKPGTHEAIYDDGFNPKTRLVAYPMPDGFNVIADYRLIEARPRYHFVKEPPMAKRREIKVTLTADVQDYIDALARAGIATGDFVEILRNAGVADDVIADAITAVVKLLREKP